MKKQKALKILNAVIALVFISVITSALLNDFISPGAYELVHVIPGFTLALLVIVHVILNFSWIKMSYFKKKS